MTYQDDGWVRVTAYMPPEVVAKLDDAARRDRRSRAEMVRLAVERAYVLVTGDLIPVQRPARAERASDPEPTKGPDPRPLLGAGLPKPAAPSRHAFTPREGNALRCATCGAGKAGHKT